MKKLVSIAFAAVVIFATGCGDKATFATKQDIKDLQEKSSGSGPLEKPAVTFNTTGSSPACIASASEVWIFETAGENVARTDEVLLYNTGICEKWSASGISPVAYFYQHEWIYSEAGLKAGSSYKICARVENITSVLNGVVKIMDGTYSFKYDPNVPVDLNLKGSSIKPAGGAEYCDFKASRTPNK